jgi:hypothetical protein
VPPFGQYKIEEAIAVKITDTYARRSLALLFKELHPTEGV